MNNVSVLHGLLDELLNAHSAFLNGDIPQPVFNLKRSEVMKAIAQPSEQPAISFPMLPTNAEAEAEADRLFGERRKQVAKPLIEQPGDVGRDVPKRVTRRDVVNALRKELFEADGYVAGRRFRDDPSGAMQEFIVDFVLKFAALSPSVPTEAVAWTLIDEDGEAQDIEFDETKARERAADYEWTVAPLYTAAPPANDEAERLLSECRQFPRMLMSDSAEPTIVRENAKSMVARIDKLLGQPPRFSANANDEAVRLLEKAHGWMGVRLNVGKYIEMLEADKAEVAAFLASQHEEKG